MSSLPFPRFAKKFLRFAEEHRQTPEALTALIWYCHLSGVGDLREKERAQQLKRAVVQLQSDHVAEATLAPAFPTLCCQVQIEEVRAFFNAVRDRSPHRQVKGLATYNLAEGLLSRTNNAAADDPDRIEAERLLEIVVADYANVPTETKEDAHYTDVLRRGFLPNRTVTQSEEKGLAPVHPGTLGELAARKLNELRNLIPGKTAPELTARSLDGDEYRLTSQRDGIVVVVFTALYCGPCVAMKPDLLKLIENHQAEGVTVVSIYDDEPELIQKSENVLKHSRAINVTAKVGEEPSLDKWARGAIPTTYILDQKRTIRFRKVGRASLAELEAAVKEILDGKGG